PASEATSANLALLAIRGHAVSMALAYAIRRSECFGLHRNTFPQFDTQCPLQVEEGRQVTSEKRAGRFYGWRVVHAAFVLALFGWGVGFFGPPIFLSVIRESQGWSLVLISAAVSLHLLAGAVTGANFPALHQRVGLAM